MIVLRRTNFMMGLFSVALVLCMIGSPLPLYFINDTTTTTITSTNVTTTTTAATTASPSTTPIPRVSISFFERCPLNSSNSDRVIASKCHLFKPDECNGGGVSIIGKLACVAATVFTGATVICHLLLDYSLFGGPSSSSGEKQPSVANLTHSNFYISGSKLLSALSCFFSFLWWIMSAVSISTSPCSGTAAGNTLAGFSLGPNLFFGLCVFILDVVGTVFICVYNTDAMLKKND